MSRRISTVWRWFGLSAGIVAADQLTKWLVLGYFENRYPRVELTGFFNLVLVFNKGAAFSLFAQAAGWQTPLLAAFALAAAVIVSVLIVRNPGRGLLCLGLALILGGALGNLIDRVRFGHVVDFLDFHALGWHWPAFNVADSAISVGALILILEGFVHHEKRAGAPS
jgi:signal peptidase II